jgi:hypothetical protein
VKVLKQVYSNYDYMGDATVYTLYLVTADDHVHLVNLSFSYNEDDLKWANPLKI